MNRLLVGEMAAALLFLIGCAAQPKMSGAPAFDFSAVHRIGVLAFEGQGGPAVRNEVVRQLVGSGIAVSDNDQNVDALLTGAVTDYKSGNKVLIFLGRAKVSIGGQTTDVDNPIISVGLAQLPSDAITFAAQMPQITASHASVSITARLSDPRTKRPVWGADSSYEGLDLAGATVPAVDLLLGAMKRSLPAMQKPAKAVSS